MSNLNVGKLLVAVFNNNNNNNVLLRTRGPYHRHKSTKSG